MTGSFMRTKAVLLALLMATVSLSGCFGEEEIIPEPVPVVEEDPKNLCHRQNRSFPRYDTNQHDVPIQ